MVEDLSREKINRDNTSPNEEAEVGKGQDNTGNKRDHPLSLYIHFLYLVSSASLFLFTGLVLYYQPLPKVVDAELMGIGIYGARVLLSHFVVKHYGFDLSTFSKWMVLRSKAPVLPSSWEIESFYLALICAPLAALIALAIGFFTGSVYYALVTVALVVPGYFLE